VAAIFLAHAREDSHRAEHIANALTALGQTVALDAEFPAGSDYRREIERRLKQADCVVVLWSRASIKSGWVRDEAEYALQISGLVQAVVDDVRPPSLFRHLRTHNLCQWTGELDIEQLKALVEEVAQIPGPISAQTSNRHDAAAAKPGKPSIRSAVAPNRRLIDESRLSVNRHSKIFLCYRRDDSQDATGRLHDHLLQVYRSEQIVMDIDTIPPGVDFVDHINEQLERCTAVIAVIGRSWSTIIDHRGRRRLDQPDDLVRREIAIALRRQLPIIPVLVQGASMPHADELAEEIRPFARRNAISLSPVRWQEDVRRLVRALERFGPPPSKAPRVPASASTASKLLLSSMRKAADGISVSVFTLNDDRNGEAEFVNLRRTVPNDFFATRAGHGMWRIHRLHCSSLAFNGNQKLTRSPKVYSRTEQDIREWARRFSVALADCSRCLKPKLGHEMLPKSH
jgi:hypothetical protein